MKTHVKKMYEEELVMLEKRFNELQSMVIDFSENSSHEKISARLSEIMDLIKTRGNKVRELIAYEDRDAADCLAGRDVHEAGSCSCKPIKY